jgi:hypothetical protein
MKYTVYRLILISKRMLSGWAEHVACSTYGGKRKVHTGFWWGDQREGDQLGDPGVDGRIILKWIFTKWDGA